MCVNVCCKTGIEFEKLSHAQLLVCLGCKGSSSGVEPQLKKTKENSGVVLLGFRKGNRGCFMSWEERDWIVNNLDKLRNFKK